MESLEAQAKPFLEFKYSDGFLIKEEAVKQAVLLFKKALDSNNDDILKEYYVKVFGYDK